MIKIKFTLLWVFTLFISWASFAQQGSDPAVTSRNINPSPLTSIGQTFSLTFTIGNNGAVAITGDSFSNQMQFSICMGKSVPSNTSNPSASLSGPLLNYFNVNYDANSNCFIGAQKSGVAIPAISVYDLNIEAKVTALSSTTADASIGANCNIQPNASANPQPTDNDQASIYTYTTYTTAQPVSLLSFVPEAQPNRTVLVTWKTSWEKANQGYIVERSKDLVNFEAVGEVNDVAGTSNSVSTYKLVDNAPFRGTSYYRLRQIDLDGTNHTFKAEPVVIDGKYGVYPNPVAGSSFVLDLDEPSNAVLHLYSSNGSEIGITKSDATELSTKVNTMSKLSSGVYILTVDERGTTRKHRLVVQ